MDLPDHGLWRSRKKAEIVDCLASARSRKTQLPGEPMVRFARVVALGIPHHIT
jgi:hypothetical protein